MLPGFLWRSELATQRSHVGDNIMCCGRRVKDPPHAGVLVRVRGWEQRCAVRSTRLLPVTSATPPSVSVHRR